MVYSSTVLVGSYEVLRRLYEGFRIPQDSMRVVGPEAL